MSTCQYLRVSGRESCELNVFVRLEANSHDVAGGHGRESVADLTTTCPERVVAFVDLLNKRPADRIYQ